MNTNNVNGNNNNQVFHRQPYIYRNPLNRIIDQFTGIIRRTFNQDNEQNQGIRERHNPLRYLHIEAMLNSMEPRGQMFTMRANTIAFYQIDTFLAGTSELEFVNQQELNKILYTLFHKMKEDIRFETDVSETLNKNKYVVEKLALLLFLFEAYETFKKPKNTQTANFIQLSKKMHAFELSITRDFEIFNTYLPLLKYLNIPVDTFINHDAFSNMSVPDATVIENLAKQIEEEKEVNFLNFKWLNSPFTFLTNYLQENYPNYSTETNELFRKANNGEAISLKEELKQVRRSHVKKIFTVEENIFDNIKNAAQT